MNCPRCGSPEISPSERDFARDYSFWVVLAAVFALMAGAFLFFLFLQLHPVILVLIAVAAVSWLLDTGKRRRKKTQATEYICLSCDHRFKRRKTSDD